MKDAKPRTAEFVGTPCSDGDFHWLVDVATFEKITGDEPTADDKAGRATYRLYPEMLAGALRCKSKVRVKFTVAPV